MTSPARLPSTWEPPVRLHRQTTITARAARTAATFARWLTGPAAVWTAATLTRIRDVLLTVAGLALLTAAAWTLHLTAGLAAGGVAVLYLQYLLADSGERQ